MNNEDILKSPEIPRSEVRWLFSDGYYDGVLSGMLLYKGKKYWFQMFDQTEVVLDDEGNVISENDWYRKYTVIELTEKQIKHAEFWQALFNKYVAVYCDYDENEKPLGGDFPRICDRKGIPYALGARPEAYHQLYYKMRENSEIPPIDYGCDDGTVIGWFRD